MKKHGYSLVCIPKWVCNLHARYASPLPTLGCLQSRLCAMLQDVCLDMYSASKCMPSAMQCQYLSSIIYVHQLHLIRHPTRPLSIELH